MMTSLLAVLLTTTHVLGAGDPAPQSTVVVELFTSEGCSSCPPADKLLAEIAKESPVKGVQIIPLAMHVDYWDNLGWKDPFSAASFTQRQADYQKALRTSSLYTPQAVVNGNAECVGSDREALPKLIAAAKPVRELALKLTGLDGNELELLIDGLTGADGARPMLAITEDDLVTEVRRGENAGRKLQHMAVVRLLKPLENLTPGKPLATKIQLDPAWKRERLHIIVIEQSDRSRSIVSAGSATLPHD